MSSRKLDGEGQVMFQLIIVYLKLSKSIRAAITSKSRSNIWRFFALEAICDLMVR
jgi:hypothetical protein